jgi:purine/pyrimidine-nucleoside phosphorylase
MSLTEKFDGVAVATKANVYFDGKCVSHSIVLADGTKKSVGVILPATLTFNTGAPEIMEGVAGSCRVRLKGESEWKTYGAGQSFDVPGNSSFDIEVAGEPYHYVCHFG